jgi:Outer membrane protein beta-barrel domain
MKKILLVACAVVGISYANAQVSFGVKAGLNVSTVNASKNIIDEPLKARPTFHVGGLANISLGKLFTLQPQLLLSGKGTNVNHGDHTDTYKFMAIDIPVNFLYNAGKGLWFGAGPNFGYNLSGKIETHEGGMHEEEEIKFGSGAGELKRLDLGVNLTAGYQLKSGILFSANYTAGLSNWSNVANSTYRNNILGISVGYVFGKKK